MTDFTSVTIGVYLFMSLYHLMIFFGRRKDKSSLAYSLLSFIFIINLYFIRIYPNSSQFNPFFYRALLPLCASLTGISLAAFTHTIFDLRSIRVYTWISVFVLFLSNLVLGGVYLLTSDVFMIQILFGIILLSLVVFSIQSIYFIIKKRQYQDRKKRIVLIGYLMLLVEGCFFIIFEAIFSKPPPFQIMHAGIFLMTTVFAFAMIDGFNREHIDLLNLKNELEDKVRMRTKQLEEMDVDRTTFFVNIAHETRTPLSLISGYLEKLSESAQATIEIKYAKKNINKMIRAILNILDIEKLEKGISVFDHKKSIELRNFVRQKLDMFNELAKNKSLSLRMEIKEEIYIRFDPSALDGVLNNLIENAIKYNKPDGSIIISATKDLDSKMVRLIIKDTGIGMEANQLDHIFEQYYQISKSKQEFRGIGVGLYLVKKIMDSAGLRISVKSEPGVGTSFTLHLESDSNSDIEQNEEIELQQKPLDYSIDRKLLTDPVYKVDVPTILAVEDNGELLGLIRDGLSDKYNLYLALNGFMALEKLKVIPKPQLILSDIMMEKMDGLEFFQAVQKLDEYKGIPFIFLTARATKSQKLAGLRHGAVDYITKPFSLRMLKAKIAAQIGIQKEAKESIMKEIGAKLTALLSTQNFEGQEKKQKLDLRNTAIVENLEKKYSMSRREIEIAFLLKDGLLYKEIADRLHLSVNTVETYRKRIFKKCRIQNKTELLNILNTD